MLSRARLITRFVTTQAAPQTELSEATRRYWNRVGDWYLKYNYENSTKMYETMASFLRLEKAKKVLDAGCGAGNGVPAMKKFAGPNTKFTLVDISDYFVQKARESNPGVEVLQQDAEALSFNDSSFDVYISNGLLEIVKKPDWVVSEAYRVLKPGGVASFSIYGRMGICNTLRIYKSIRNKLGIKRGTAEPKFELADPEKVKALVKSVGFKRVVYFYEQYHFNVIEPKDIFGMYLDNPVLREGATQVGKSHEFENLVKQELEEILFEKEEPLIYEALVVTAYKE
ncbi:unnamed protein product [Blepharisma stoltei]|uniref:Methyltransferase type 11 domain-containing protein n=1 Tax=Blepharisma stoltei TaxID=1481888 RepID=A0AAU9IUW6_9CILI|nr:unnamed protein product [Blepharisma stoltei]